MMMTSAAATIAYMPSNGMIDVCQKERDNRIPSINSHTISDRGYAMASFCVFLHRHLSRNIAVVFVDFNFGGAFICVCVFVSSQTFPFFHRANLKLNQRL